MKTIYWLFCNGYIYYKWIENGRTVKANSRIQGNKRIGYRRARLKFLLLYKIDTTEKLFDDKYFQFLHLCWKKIEINNNEMKKLYERAIDPWNSNANIFYTLGLYD